MKRAAVVIGGGVNELVAAHYLARAGHEVTLVREGTAPADDAFETGWITPGIVRDLGLDREGLLVRQPDPWALVWPEAFALELTRDVAASARAIARLSPADGAKWGAFCARMHALARVLESLYTAPPPDPVDGSKAGLVSTALRVRRLGRRGMEDLFRLLPMSAADFLDEWFENDALKGVLGAAAVMNLRQGPRSGGTAFNLLHHHVGSPPGVFRPPISNLRAVLTRRAGIAIRAGAVTRIDVREGRAAAVVLDGGEEIAASLVVSGLAPARTLLELVDPAWLDPQLVRSIRNIRSRGPSARISLTLDRDPRFTTLVVAPSLDYLERAYDHVKYGRVSTAPYLEARNLGEAGPQRFRVELHVQYVPYRLAEGAWDTARAEKLARDALARLSEVVPGLSASVVGQQVLTPEDLDHIHGYPEGQEYHAELALDQVLWMRPVPALAQYRTPIEGLYLCGPAMHPGGGIAGAAGANAAGVVLRGLRRG